MAKGSLKLWASGSDSCAEHVRPKASIRPRWVGTYNWNTMSTALIPWKHQFTWAGAFAPAVLLVFAACTPARAPNPASHRAAPRPTKLDIDARTLHTRGRPVCGHREVFECIDGGDKRAFGVCKRVRLSRPLTVAEARCALDDRDFMHTYPDIQLRVRGIVARENVSSAPACAFHLPEEPNPDSCAQPVPTLEIVDRGPSSSPKALRSSPPTPNDYGRSRTGSKLRRGGPPSARRTQNGHSGNSGS